MVGAVEPNAQPNPTPEFIRLPRSGQLCPWTGLTRSKLNELILPSEANSFKPAVKSVSLRPKGAVKGTRLIVYNSLVGYLRSRIEGGCEEAA
jgi:hypothetical protein